MLTDYKNSACKIYSRESSLICIGKISVVEADFIAVVKEKYNFPVYPYASDVAIVFEGYTRHIIYKATVEKSSKDTLILINLNILTQQNRRKFFRVNVNISTISKFMYSESDPKYRSYKTNVVEMPIFIHNISCSGLLIETPEPIKTGTIMEITIPLANKTDLLLNVESTRWVSTQDGNLNMYGCEFVDNKASVIDILYKQILKFEQQMIVTLLSLDD